MSVKEAIESCMHEEYRKSRRKLDSFILIQGWIELVTQYYPSLCSQENLVLWPRDVLLNVFYNQVFIDLKYLQLMETLEENMKEYQLLQEYAGIIFNLQ